MQKISWFRNHCDLLKFIFDKAHCSLYTDFNTFDIHFRFFFLSHWFYPIITKIIFSIQRLFGWLEFTWLIPSQIYSTMSLCFDYFHHNAFEMKRSIKKANSLFRILQVFVILYQFGLANCGWSFLAVFLRQQHPLNPSTFRYDFNIIVSTVFILSINK